MTDQSTVRFRLEGLEYSLRGDKSPQQLQQIVDLVCQKVEELRRVAPHYSAVRISTLTALHLAEELMEAREEARLLLEEGADQNRAAQRRRRSPRQEERAAEPEDGVLFPEHLL